MSLHFLRLCLGLVSAILIVDGARADVGFWPRTDLDIRFRFENLNDYPSYDFYLKYGLGRGDPAHFHLTKLESGTLARLEGGGDRFFGVVLIAVPYGQKVKLPPQNQPIQDENLWYKQAPSGGLQCDLRTETGRPVSNGDHNYELTYRVEMTDGELAASLAEARNPTLRWWLAISALGLLTIAAWFVVARMRKHANKTANKGTFPSL